MQDHYETLQVHPRADQETIQAAYERLRARHDPAALADAAEELQELARQKRDAIEQAYAILSDDTRRAAYDDEQQRASAPPATPATDAAGEELLDYRPLPPAHGQERPRNFDTQPRLLTQEAPQGGRQAGQQQRRRAWVVPAVLVAVITAGIMLSSLLLTDGGRPRYAENANAMPQESQAAPAAQSGQGSQSHAELIGGYEDQLIAARQVVEQLPDNPEAWARLGNALYNRVQVERELQGQSPSYQEYLPLWLEASDAYARALELGTESAVVRSDMGVSLCYYGMGSGEQTYVAQGSEHTQQALHEASQNGRVLLNHGICLVSQEPAQTEQAVALWQAVLNLPAAETGVTQHAQILLQEYNQ